MIPTEDWSMEKKRVKEEFEAWTWGEMFMVFALFVGVIMALVLMGFLVGIGFGLGQGLF